MNNKKKFSLDNHFDRKNSKQFLVEKDKYLSEMIIDDEPSKKDDNIEKSHTVNELVYLYQVLLINWLLEEYSIYFVFQNISICK